VTTWRVDHGDCLDLLRAMPDASVDACLTDPPYSSGGQFRGDRAGSTKAKYLGSYGSTTAGKLPEVLGDSRDSLGWAMWATLWLSQCYRVSVIGAPCVVFADWRQLPNLSSVFQAAGWTWRGVIVWDKGGSCRPMSGRFAHQCEYAVWGTKGPLPWDYEAKCMPGCFKHNPPSSKAREHQTEKPVALMSDLLGIVKAGGTVLDPFCGSGSTGVACAKMGLNFVGMELGSEYVEIARRRIAEAAARPMLEGIK
jgi:site-specific DNA-methyltransferase (adenine-specific)